ncbi:MAG: hypothetical protein GTO63_14855 [Anaerolineae bacterium]|nr:hypothetical protein [Anaerolineae bacterium]NIN96127.1 hypothetical protein [Anaerolineae bacterium]
MAGLGPNEPEVLDLTIAELIRRWPDSTSVLISQRMACIGCLFFDFHTLGEALEIYSLPSETFLPLLAEVVQHRRQVRKLGNHSKKGGT